MVGIGIVVALCAGGAGVGWIRLTAGPGTVARGGTPSVQNPPLVIAVRDLGHDLQCQDGLGPVPSFGIGSISYWCRPHAGFPGGAALLIGVRAQCGHRPWVNNSYDPLYQTRSGGWRVILAIPVPLGVPIVPQPCFRQEGSLGSLGWSSASYSGFYDVGPAAAVAISAIRSRDPRCPENYAYATRACMYRLFARHPVMLPLARRARR